MSSRSVRNSLIWPRWPPCCSFCTTSLLYFRAFARAAASPGTLSPHHLPASPSCIVSAQLSLCQRGYPLPPPHHLSASVSPLNSALHFFIAHVPTEHMIWLLVYLFIVSLADRLQTLLGLCLFFSLLYPQGLDLHLAHSGASVAMCCYCSYPVPGNSQRHCHLGLWRKYKLGLLCPLVDEKKGG